MSELKYKVGDKVRIKSLDWYNENKDNYDCVYAGNGFGFWKNMVRHCGEIMKITSVKVDPEDSNKGYYFMENSENRWTDEMIEGLVEEETKPEFDYVAAMDDLMGLDIEKSCILNDFDEYKKAVEKHGYFSEEALTRKLFINLRKNGTAQNVLENFGFNLPDGYIFKDENGNVINATKIVLEKKKKKEYPKTYDECCKVLGVDSDNFLSIRNLYRDDGDEELTDYERDLLGKFDSLWELRICRDAYWKIAGDEMGLGKPWKPDWNDGEWKWCISYSCNCVEFDQYKSKHHTLAFPTKEMRDAFYEYFKEEIEICKEFL